MEKLMIFIDGGNLFNGSKKENIQIDFVKLINFLSKDYNLIRTYYYTGIPTKELWKKSKNSRLSEKQFEEKYNKQYGFLESLQFDHKFHVITKPLVEIGNMWKEKGIDVNIACDIIWHGLCNNYDTFMLISGDKDLLEVLHRMKDNGKKVIIANFKNSVSRDMERICDKFVDLSRYKESIEKE